jgi:hypothetical protein
MEAVMMYVPWGLKQRLPAEHNDDHRQIQVGL